MTTQPGDTANSHAELINRATHALTTLAQARREMPGTGPGFGDALAHVLAQAAMSIAAGHGIDRSWATGQTLTEKTHLVSRLVGAGRPNGQAQPTEVDAESHERRTATEAITALVQYDVAAARGGSIYTFTDDLVQALTDVSASVGGLEELLEGPADTRTKVAIAHLVGVETSTESPDRAQAWAWLAATDRVQCGQLNQHIENIPVNPATEPVFDRILWELVEQWRGRSYDHINPDEREAVQTAEAEAWLYEIEPDLLILWSDVNGKAISESEVTQDRKKLTHLWAAATGAGNAQTTDKQTVVELSESLRQDFTELANLRRDRLAQAESWMAATYPLEYDAWHAQRNDIPEMEQTFTLDLVHLWQDQRDRSASTSLNEAEAQRREVGRRLQIAPRPEDLDSDHRQHLHHMQNDRAARDSKAIRLAQDNAWRARNAITQIPTRHAPPGI